MGRRYYSNTASQQTLNASITSSATSLAINGSFAGWPTQFPFSATIDYGQSSVEVVSVTAISGKVATIVRGQGGTSAISHLAGATFDCTVVAQDFDEANSHINSSSGVHGIAGSVVGTTDAQTLTNKTLDAPTVTGTLAGADASLGGDLTVAGNTTLAGVTAADVGAAAVTASGPITASDGVAVTGGLTTDTVDATGDATVGGDLGVTGGLDVTGNVTAAGTLDVTGNTTIAGSLEVTGATVLNIPRAEYTEAAGGTTLGTTFKTLGVSTKIVDTINLTYASGVLTFPAGSAGSYKISAGMGAGGSTDPCAFAIAILKNNSILFRALVDFSGVSGPPTISIPPREISIADGDSVKVQGFCSVAGYTTTSTAGYQPYIRVERVG